MLLPGTAFEFHTSVSSEHDPKPQRGTSNAMAETKKMNAGDYLIKVRLRLLQIAKFLTWFKKDQSSKEAIRNLLDSVHLMEEVIRAMIGTNLLAEHDDVKKKNYVDQAAVIAELRVISKGLSSKSLEARIAHFDERSYNNLFPMMQTVHNKLVIAAGYIRMSKLAGLNYPKPVPDGELPF